MMLATLRIETLQEIPVARVSGEIDASNAREIGDRLLGSVPNTAMGLVIDLSDTEYMDSSGVHLLFELGDRLARRQQALRVVVPADSFIADILGAVTFAGMATVDATVVDAIDGLRSA